MMGAGRNEYDGEGRMTRAIIYFHYDAHDRVDDYVLRALRSLRPEAQRLLLVSNSPVPEHSGSELRQMCDDVLQRGNTDYDVGAYRDALRHIGWDRLPEYEEVVLTNHTFYAPVRPWSGVFDRADSWDDVDFWGITEHAAMRPHPFLARRELPRHLNSHWIAVRRPVLLHPAFRRYWESMPGIDSYRASIQWHESRFTEHFGALGFRHRAIFPVDGYRCDNPAVEEALALLDDGCPFLKRRALFHDPVHQEAVGSIGRDVLDAACSQGYPRDIILSDLARTAVPRDLVANAGLTEILPETGAPERAREELGRVRGCAVVHATTAAGAAVIAERLHRLEIGWPVVTTVPSALPAGEQEEIERLLGARDGAQIRRVADDCADGTAALLRDCADLLEPGRYDLLLRLVCPLPEEGATASSSGRRALDCLVTSARLLAAACRLFEEHPALGLVLPPIPQVGAAVEGHGWDGLRTEAQRVAIAAGISTAFDSSTPLAPYAGVFLCRPQALAPLAGLFSAPTDPAVAFPDGTCARALGRLICYSALSQGLWCEQVMTARWAAIDYSLLENRSQAIAALLPGPVEERLPFLAARLGDGASFGAAVRTSLVSSHPRLADALKPVYRLLASAGAHIRRRRRGR